MSSGERSKRRPLLRLFKKSRGDKDSHSEKTNGTPNENGLTPEKPRNITSSFASPKKFRAPPPPTSSETSAVPSHPVGNVRQERAEDRLEWTNKTDVQSDVDRKNNEEAEKKVSEAKHDALVNGEQQEAKEEELSIIAISGSDSVLETIRKYNEEVATKAKVDTCVLSSDDGIARTSSPSSAPTSPDIEDRYSDESFTKPAYTAANSQPVQRVTNFELRTKSRMPPIPVSSFDDDPRGDIYSPTFDHRRMSIGSTNGIDDEDLRREYGTLTELFAQWEATASQPDQLNSSECLHLQRQVIAQHKVVHGLWQKALLGRTRSPSLSSLKIASIRSKPPTRKNIIDLSKTMFSPPNEGLRMAPSLGNLYVQTSEAPLKAWTGSSMSLSRPLPSEDAEKRAALSTNGVRLLSSTSRSTMDISRTTAPFKQTWKISQISRTDRWGNAAANGTPHASASATNGHDQELDEYEGYSDPTKPNKPTPQHHLESSLRSYEERKRQRRESKTTNVPSVSQSSPILKTTSPTVSLTKRAHVSNGTPPSSSTTYNGMVTPSKSYDGSAKTVDTSVRKPKQEEEKRYVTTVVLGTSRPEPKVTTARVAPVSREPLHLRAHSEPKLPKMPSDNENPFGTVLRSVGPPVEKCGVETGRVLDGEPAARKQSPTSSPSADQRAPAPPPPPPPPPPSLLNGGTKRAPGLPDVLPARMDADQLKRELREATLKSVPQTSSEPKPPADPRDMLMDEIRKAGGRKALRRVDR